MTKTKRKKEQTMIYKTPHRTLQIERHEHHQKPEVNSGASEGLDVHAPHVTPVVLFVFTNCELIILVQIDK